MAMTEISTRSSGDGMTEISARPSGTGESWLMVSNTSPVHLLFKDLLIIVKNAWAIPGTVLPLWPPSFDPLDELSINFGNLGDCMFHGILVALQLGFLGSLPFTVILPFGTFLCYFIGVMVLNWMICLRFNGFKSKYKAVPRQGIKRAGKGEEKWIFLNGVSVGHRWLQNNVQKLANTFGRRVIAYHNPTSGIIFDLVQCLIERDFSYNTGDVREAYGYIKKQLLAEKNKTVVLIVHSQGAIEGSMVVDWLLQDMEDKHLGKLEIYTFGNAANHFNNPIRRRDGEDGKDLRPIRHIEHYANRGDFVARFGVLNFAKGDRAKRNRFYGQVLERKGSGHMMNQHYLNTMFPMVGNKVAESNDFMDSKIKFDQSNSSNNYMQNHQHHDKVKDLSRLWNYRNGMTPPRIS